MDSSASPSSSSSIILPPTRESNVEPIRRGGRLEIAARRHPLIAEIAQRLRHSCAFIGGPLIIGVSGGADSTALLLASIVLRDRKRNLKGNAIEPIAVHVHHHLRGEEADLDAEHVAALCDRLAVDFEIVHIHPGGRRGTGGNLADRSRRMRYDALRDAAARRDASAVAVAHHASDQFETMLMALCRGAAAEGLAGMAWSSMLSNRVRLLRPLLGSTRDDIDSFCRAANVRWREDATNRDRSTARGRLRADVTPVLEELWPGTSRHLEGVTETLRAARDIIAAEVERVFGEPPARQWDRSLLREQPTAVLTAGLRASALDAAPDCRDALTHTHLRDAAAHIRAADHEPRRLHWPCGLQLAITSRSVELHQREAGLKSS